MDENEDAERVARDQQRFTGPWQAVGNIVETADGRLHVATASGDSLAQHIAELHNRTLGEGQDPPPGYGQTDPGVRNEAPTRANWPMDLPEMQVSRGGIQFPTGPDPWAGVPSDQLAQIDFRKDPS
jgi:hypothetical protein